MEIKETTLILKKLYECVIDEMKSNSQFADKIGLILEGHTVKSPIKRTKRRSPAKLNPLELISADTIDLESRLQRLSVEELKDIIAEYGMDNAKLAMNWKKKDRLIALILETSQRRSKKGDVFRE